MWTWYSRLQSSCHHRLSAEFMQFFWHFRFFFTQFHDALFCMFGQFLRKKIFQWVTFKKMDTKSTLWWFGCIHCGCCGIFFFKLFWVCDCHKENNCILHWAWVTLMLKICFWCIFDWHLLATFMWDHHFRVSKLCCNIIFFGGEG